MENTENKEPVVVDYSVAEPLVSFAHDHALKYNGEGFPAFITIVEQEGTVRLSAAGAVNDFAKLLITASNDPDFRRALQIASTELAFVDLQDAVKDRMKSLGIIDDNGQPTPDAKQKIEAIAAKAKAAAGPKDEPEVEAAKKAD